jgi:putative transposase
MRHFIAGGPNMAAWDASMIAELKSLQEENRRLKKMYAEVQLQREILQEAMRKKW